MVSRHGARCTIELKRVLLDAFRTRDDQLVLGYTADRSDVARFERFFDSGSDRPPRAPLIERGLTKADCLAMVERAGIVLPEMYRRGFSNANCVGCVKGGEGYWNKIRREFPEDFAEVSAIQEEIGPGAYFFRDRKTGRRISLRELSPDAGRDDETLPDCSFFCEAAEDALTATPTASGSIVDNS